MGVCVKKKLFYCFKKKKNQKMRFNVLWKGKFTIIEFLNCNFLYKIRNKYKSLKGVAYFINTFFLSLANKCKKND